MIKVDVFYAHKQGGKFDMAYYLEKHIPMVRKKLGDSLKGVAVEQGIAGGEPGAPPTYTAIGHLLFDSIETFMASFGPVGAEIKADVPNYTNVEPVIQISEVKL